MTQVTSGAGSGLAWAQRARLLTVVAVFPLVSVLFDCSRAPPDPSSKDLFASRAMTQRQGPVTVSAAVLSADESQRYFGAGLADQGIQAIWLSVENGSDATLYYLPVTTDPSYFSPSEAAQLLREWWSDKANTATNTVLVRDAMSDIVPPHQTAAGFVLTHREGGLKFINAGFVGGGQQFDFRFVLPLGGRTYAVQKVDFSGLYPPGTIEAIDLAGASRTAGAVALLHGQQGGRCVRRSAQSRNRWQRRRGNFSVRHEGMEAGRTVRFSQYVSDDARGPVRYRLSNRAG